MTFVLRSEGRWNRTAAYHSVRALVDSLVPLHCIHPPGLRRHNLTPPAALPCASAIYARSVAFAFLHSVTSRRLNFARPILYNVSRIVSRRTGWTPRCRLHLQHLRSHAWSHLPPRRRTALAGQAKWQSALSAWRTMRSARISSALSAFANSIRSASWTGSSGSRSARCTNCRLNTLMLCVGNFPSARRAAYSEHCSFLCFSFLVSIHKAAP